MRNILITGGAGFIGSNLTNYFLNKGERVIVFDNLSRSGVEKNLQWLGENFSNNKNFIFVKGDIRNESEINAVVKGVDIVFHIAGQVAVTTSVEQPRPDFEINALGTFNVLEAIRQYGSNPIVLFTSTNKVYGGMEDVAVIEKNNKYLFRDYPEGISEMQNLDFHSPYGCSKGTADQYVHDYSRIYGMKSIVFRMSCQYGIRQFGNEDQGWVAHFVISAVKKKGLTIYGDGKQVRDVLFIDDLIQAFEKAIDAVDVTAGKLYNIGGGPQNILSLLELMDILEQRLGYRVPTIFSDWRPGDQPVYISNIEKAKKDFGWEPTISVNEGLDKLINWVNANSQLFG